MAGRPFPAPVFLVLLPILVIGFFFSVLFRQFVLAAIIALLAVGTVVRLALANRGPR